MNSDLIKAYANFAILFLILAWAGFHIYIDTPPGLYQLDLHWAIIIAIPVSISFSLYMATAKNEGDSLFRYMIAVVVLLVLWELMGNYIFYSVEAITAAIWLCYVAGDMWHNFGGKLTLLSINCRCRT